MGRSYQRILSLVLALLMVLGMLPSNVFAAEGTQTDPHVYEAEYNTMTNGDLYTWLVRDFGAPQDAAHSLLGAVGFQIGGELLTVTSGDDTTLVTSLVSNTAYEVKKATKTGSGFSTRWVYQSCGWINPLFYYAITATLADGSPAGAGVTVVTPKFYINKDSTATIEVNRVEGYVVQLQNATVTTTLDDDTGYTYNYTPFTSSNWTVTYVSAEKPKHNVTLNVNGDEFGDATLSATGEQPEGTNVTLTATPAANGYIESIVVEGAEYTQSGIDANRVQTGTFAVGTSDVTVTVTFAEKKLDHNTTANVKFNPMKTVSEQLDDLKKAIFDSVVNSSLPEGLEWNDAGLTYTYKSTRLLSAAVYRDLTWSASGSDYGYSEFPTELGEEAEIMITWAGDSKYPEISVIANITLVDSREVATITYTDPGPVIFESQTEIDAAVWGAARSNSTGEITVALKDGETLPGAGETAKVTYIITVAEDVNYQGHTEEVTVTVQGKTSPATVSITVNGTGTASVGTVSDNGTLFTGPYDLVATPGANCYVSAITVNGEALDVEDLSKYNNCVFTDSVNIVNDQEYNIVVTFAERTIDANSGVEVDFNPYKKNNILNYSGYPTELEAKILTALGVADISGLTMKVHVDSGDTWLSLSNWLTGTAALLALNVGEEPIQLTLEGDARYPEITAEVTVKLVDERKACSLVSTDLGSKDFTSEDEVTAFINENASRYNPDNLTPVTVTRATELPADCNVPTQVTYEVKFDGDVNYQGGSCQVTVTATRKAHQCEIVADADLTANGTLTGGGLVDGLTEVEVTVTPVSGYAVESITITGSDDTQIDKTGTDISYNNTSATVTFTTDGSTEKVTYTVSATYSETSLVLNENAVITYCEDQTDKPTGEELRKMVFNAVYGSSNPNITAETAGVKLEYKCSELGDYGIDWVEVGSNPSIDFGDIPIIGDLIGDLIHKFGEKGTETIRVTYTDAKYGTLQATVTLTVNDACYNNTIVVEEVDDQKGESSTVSIAANGVESTKTYNGTDYYKENTTYTITVAPGNSLLNNYPPEAAYVESIVVTDKAGNVVETSAIDYQPAKTILGINYSEPTANVTFTTGSNKEYTVTVTYGTSSFKVIEEAVVMNMYPGGEGYEACVPTAEDLFNAVITGATPEFMETYHADRVTVEYSVDGGLTYKALDTLANVADGTTVKLRITYKHENENQYHAVSAIKDVTLKDLRAATEIKHETLTGAFAYVNYDELSAALLEALAPQILSNTTVVDGTVTIEISEVVPEAGKNYVTVTLRYAGSEEYKPSTATVKVEVEDLPDNAKIDVDSDHGTVTVNGEAQFPLDIMGNTPYPVVITPAAGWAVESVTISSDAESSKAELTYKDQVASFVFTPVEKHEYTLTVKYVEAAFELEDEMSFRPGIDKATQGSVFDAVVTAPVKAAEGEIVVEYLARPAGQTVTIELPRIEIGGFVLYPGGEHSVTLPALWLEVGAEIESVDLEQIRQKIISGEVKIEEIASHLTNLYAHSFGQYGDGSTEELRLSFENNKWKIPETTHIVTISDTRTATTIACNQAVTVTYGYTAEELLAAIAPAVLANGADMGGTVTLSGSALGLNASDKAYEITVAYAGDETYRPCTATVLVTVEKAPVEVTVPSQVVTWGSDYTVGITTDPAGVSTIDFIIGIDVLNGVDGYVNVRLPGKLGEYFQAEMTLSQFVAALSELAKANEAVLEGMGFDSTTVELLNNALASLQDLVAEMPEMKVRVNEAMEPDNIGVYLVGSVTADSNYTTDAAIGYLVVVPEATQVGLEWNYNDLNGILTLPALLEGKFDLNAHAVSETLDEAALAEATALIRYQYLGILTDGTIVLEETPVAQTGAYIQLAYILDWDNDLYYAVPILRSYVVVPQSVEITFVDETGAPNRDQLRTFDGEEQVLEVKVDGEITAPNEYLTVRYYGVATNGDVLKGTETAPVHTGFYTAVATYIQRGENGEVLKVGIDVAAMVILPAEATVAVDDTLHIYNGNAFDVQSMIQSAPADAKLTVITAGIADEGDFSENGLAAIKGTVNVDFPQRLDEILKQYETLAPAYSAEGVTAADLMAVLNKYIDELVALGLAAEELESIRSFVAQLSADVTLTFHDGAACTDIGVYLVVAIVTDPDYVPTMDAGILVIAPELTKAELAFAETLDGNNIFTMDTLSVVDLSARAYVDGVYSEEATAKITNLFYGLDAEGKMVVYKSQADLLPGVYTQVAYINDLSAHMYYAEPISRVIIVVANMYDVQFVDHTGAQNHDRYYVYDGTPKDMGTVTVTDQFGETVIPADGELTVTYRGVDAWGNVYSSTEAPTEVGTYTVVASFIRRDENGNFIGAGAAVGALVIAKAEPTFDLRDTTAEYDTTGKFVDVVNPNGMSYIAVIDNGDGTVTVLLPESWNVAETVLELEDALNYLRNLLAQRPEALAELAEKLEALLDKAATTVTINGALPTELGTYEVAAIAFAKNYKVAAAKATLTIVHTIHSYGEWYELTAPTCTEAGEERHDCQYCDHYETQPIEATGHEYESEVTEPTCTEGGYTTHTCTKCDDSYVDSETEALGHDFGEWTVTTPVTCTEDGEEKRICTRCGHDETRIIEATGHEYEADVTEPTCTDAGYTTHTCTKCDDSYVDSETEALGHDFGEWYVVTPVTCTENGLEQRDCSRCDHYETRVIEATGHDYESVVTDPTCTEGGYTTHTCTKCDDSYVDSETEALGHDFGEWTVTTPATCTEDGEEKRICTRCGHEETRVIKATGHDYESVVKDPTCTEAGYTTHTCTNCGDSYVDTYVSALGHDMGDWYVTDPATCTEFGEERSDCSRCDHYMTRQVAPTGHNYLEVVTDPTCTEAGYTTHTCTKCGDSYTSHYESALGHAYGEWYEVTAPTCTEAGEEDRICTRCGHKETRIIEATGHEYESEVTAPNCTEGGYTTHTCTKCDDSYVDSETEALGHNFGEWTVKTAATCTEDGLEQRDCDRCEHYETRVIKATGHDYESVVKDPTCTEAGYTTHTCTKCDRSYVDAHVDALGHTFGEWTVKTAATCTEDGLEQRDCDRCEHYETRVIRATGHDYESVVTEPTCTEAGYTTHTCANCGDSYVDSRVDALGHELGEWYVTLAATCTEFGEERSDCSRCDHYVTRQVVPTGHSYVAAVTEPTCAEAGYTTHTCTNCDDSYTSHYESALGHAFGEWYVETAATCTEAGLEQRDCDRCEHYETRAIDATGHAYESVVTEPTCTEAGYTTHTCANCGDSYVDAEVEALGHVFGEWYVVEPGTCLEPGVARRDCQRCEHHEAMELSADCPSEPYEDVDQNEWYHLYVDYVIENGLMIGYDEDTFGPGMGTSRAMIAMILYRLEGSPEVSDESPYADVAEGEWYTDAITWADSVGVVLGYGNGKFGPSDKLTREQMTVILYRYAKYKGYDTTITADLGDFTDGNTVSSWAQEAVCWAVSCGMIEGMDNGKLEPRSGATRAQMAKVLWSYCTVIAGK